MIQLHSLHVVISFLAFWALFMFNGLLLARLWLIPGAAFALPQVSARWRRMLVESYALVAFSGVALLLVRTGEMDEGTLPQVLSDLPLVLTQTHFGLVWLVHLAMLLLLARGVTVTARAMPSRARTAGMAAIMLVLAFTYSASSHASDAGDFTLAEMNDWVHVVSTSAWGGGILVCALLVLPQRRDNDALVSAVAVRLSALSAAALIAVLATGFYNASKQLAGWRDVLATDYGRILAVKLAMVGLLMSFGAFNRYVIVARLRRPAAVGRQTGALPRLLFTMLAADAVLMALVLVMAAILIQNEAR